ncbi:unnamed protein product [Parajaminaea phylloscopi]
MTGNKRIAAFFGPKSPAKNNDAAEGRVDRRDSSTGMKRKKSVADEWMAADERQQLEKALRLSMQDSQIAAAPAAPAAPACDTATELSDDQRVPAATQSSVHVADRIPKSECSDEEKPPAAKAVPQECVKAPPGVASLFMSKAELAAAGSVLTAEPTATPAPLFGDDDFLQLSSAKPLAKLQGSLDCLHLPLWISSCDARRQLTEWLLTALAWHRVTYTRPGPNGGQRIVTPRFTTTFGRDDTKAPMSAYKIKPKEIPPPLQDLIRRIETSQNELLAAQGRRTKPEDLVRYNCCILNYYADGNDSISYHSDDETFLGPLPNIASLSLGATRDFKLRPKRNSAYGINDTKDQQRETLTLGLTEGTLLVMRGKTQAEWEHAIPKRTAKGGRDATAPATAAMPGIGRINITFRRLRTVAGTDNFQRYNRGPAFPVKKSGPSTETSAAAAAAATVTYRFISGRMVPASGGI